MPALPPSAHYGSAQKDDDRPEVIMAPARLRGSRTLRGNGGGGNRTRVRNRTGQSIYKLRSLLKFALRPVSDRPTVRASPPLDLTPSGE